MLVEIPAAALSVLDREAVADLFASFAMHVLFMRGQISVPFPQLQAAAAEAEEEQRQGQGRSSGGFSSSSFKLRSQHRKTAKFVAEVSALLAAIKQAVVAAPLAPTQASVFLGASAVCPREVFTLRFPPPPPPPPPAAAAAATTTAAAANTPLSEEGGGGGGGGGAATVTPDMDIGMDPRLRARKVDALRRKMLRSLVTQWQGGAGRVRLLNLAMAVHFPPTPATAVPTTPAAAADNDDGSGGEMCLLRRAEGFRPRLRRRCPPPLLCSLQAQSSEEEKMETSSGGGSDSGEEEEEGVCLVSRRTVHALRLGNQVGGGAPPGH